MRSPDADYYDYENPNSDPYDYENYSYDNSYNWDYENYDYDYEAYYPSGDEADWTTEPMDDVAGSSVTVDAEVEDAAPVPPVNEEYSYDDAIYDDYYHGHYEEDVVDELAVEGVVKSAEIADECRKVFEELVEAEQAKEVDDDPTYDYVDDYYYWEESYDEYVADQPVDLPAPPKSVASSSSRAAVLGVAKVLDSVGTMLRSASDQLSAWADDTATVASDRDATDPVNR